MTLDGIHGVVESLSEIAGIMTDGRALVEAEPLLNGIDPDTKKLLAACEVYRNLTRYAQTVQVVKLPLTKRYLCGTIIIIIGS